MVRRGEIYYVDWSAGRGSEQAGVRPALIVQNDVGNRHSSTTIVVAITTRRHQVYPFQVGITAAESGLPKDSVIKCEQVQTIDEARLGRLAGTLASEKLREVDVALHVSLGLKD